MMEQSRPSPWESELDDFVRAFCGAFLFGVPLLFTMEMWWIGSYANLWKLLLFLALTFLVNLHLAYFAGFKQEGHTFGTALGQAIDALAVGAVAAFLVLLILNRINLSDPLDSIVAKIVIQTVPLSIGASVANAVLNARGKSRQGDEGETSAQQPGHWHATLNDLGATIAGALFISFSVAPTEEIPMLAAQLDYPHELALIALSLVLSYAIVFESGFSPQRAGVGTPGPFQHPITETALAYVVALLVALLALFLFHQIDGGTPYTHVLSMTLVLGLPAAIGGAAGRLVI